MRFGHADARASNARCVTARRSCREYQLGRTLDDGLRRGVASLRRLTSCVAAAGVRPGSAHVGRPEPARARATRPSIRVEVASELDLLEVFRRGCAPGAGAATARFESTARRTAPTSHGPSSRSSASTTAFAGTSVRAAVADDNERLTALVSARLDAPRLHANARAGVRSSSARVQRCSVMAGSPTCPEPGTVPTVGTVTCRLQGDGPNCWDTGGELLGGRMGRSVGT